MAGKKKTVYRVVAPLVYLPVKDPTGNEVVYGFYQGAVVDGEIGEESLQRHLDDKMLEEITEDQLFDAFTGPEGASAPSELTKEDEERLDLIGEEPPAPAKKTASSRS